MRETLDITFFGVRGSTPSPCEENRRYGGNTSCVVLDVPGGDPILFDLGTGLQFFGLNERCGSAPFRATALVSHLHWDHIQGLPFFAPLHCADTQIDVYGPGDEGSTLEKSLDMFMTPPFFPICYRELEGRVSLHDTIEGSFDVGSARITARSVPHLGRTFGYRVDWSGLSVAYISDHQQPVDGSSTVDDQVLALADSVDLLIHDAQFTPAEFAKRPHWGHCTVDYALEVAHQAGVGELVLFHHDPAHSDDEIDRLLFEARSRATELDVGCVSAAVEGKTISLMPAEDTLAAAAPR
ncbi:MAG: MBL fold metallo-hydrolase [Acidimicrobiales bacterium]|nr:MBL fold metallo-hydrolase [Acidimicrobiales bacterium]